jgi:uncharacterized protein YggE
MTLNVLLLTFLVGSLLAQSRVAIDASLHTSDRPYIQVTGDATISAKPDSDLIEVGVVTEGTTASGVAAQNAAQSDKLILELRRLLGASNLLTTSSYSVHPNITYPKAAITVYLATNIVSVTVNDLSKWELYRHSNTIGGEHNSKTPLPPEDRKFHP